MYLLDGVASSFMGCFIMFKLSLNIFPPCVLCILLNLVHAMNEKQFCDLVYGIIVCSLHFYNFYFFCILKNIIIFIILLFRSWLLQSQSLTFTLFNSGLAGVVLHLNMYCDYKPGNLLDSLDLQFVCRVFLIYSH